MPDIPLEQLRHSMHVIGPDRRAYRGFFAFRALAGRLPALWPLVPILYLPGVPFIGTRIYAGVARNRAPGGCRMDTCAT